MFHIVSFLFSDVCSCVPMISTSGEFICNLQGSKIVHFSMLVPMVISGVGDSGGVVIWMAYDAEYVWLESSVAMISLGTTYT